MKAKNFAKGSLLSLASILIVIAVLQQGIDKIIETAGTFRAVSLWCCILFVVMFLSNAFYFIKKHGIRYGRYLTELLWDTAIFPIWPSVMVLLALFLFELFFNNALPLTIITVVGVLMPGVASYYFYLRRAKGSNDLMMLDEEIISPELIKLKIEGQKAERYLNTCSILLLLTFGFLVTAIAVATGKNGKVVSLAGSEGSRAPREASAPPVSSPPAYRNLTFFLWGKLCNGVNVRNPYEIKDKIRKSLSRKTNFRALINLANGYKADYFKGANPQPEAVVYFIVFMLFAAGLAFGLGCIITATYDRLDRKKRGASIQGVENQR